MVLEIGEKLPNPIHYTKPEGGTFAWRRIYLGVTASVTAEGNEEEGTSFKTLKAHTLAQEPISTCLPVENKARSHKELARCSICTEDFIDGEDIRLLNCAHIYHQRCIDPWLLNFAGTCPLW
jgi:protein-arginine kinase activator protein McsA